MFAILVLIDSYDCIIDTLVTIYCTSLLIPSIIPRFQGYAINYKELFWERCPTCGSTTYLTFEDKFIYYCLSVKGFWGMMTFYIHMINM